MKFNSIGRIILAVVLSISLIATGCSVQWISVALADLPVLTQMALNIAALIATLQSGEQLSPTEALGIQNISIEASKDLILLQGLYNAYKSNPSPATLQKIKSVIADINQNLPALLQAVHISDAALSVRITAALNLIVTTVSSFESLIPPVPPSPKTARQNTVEQNVPQRKTVRENYAILNPKDFNGTSRCVLRLVTPCWTRHWVSACCNEQKQRRCNTRSPSAASSMALPVGAHTCWFH